MTRYLHTALLLICVGCSIQKEIAPLKPVEQEFQVNPYQGSSVSYSEARFQRGFSDLLTHTEREEVQRYLEYYQQGKGLMFVEDGMKRMQQHQSDVVAILDKYNLPVELLSVPLVESRFRKNARSPRGAVGIWQLTSPAARKGGLSVSMFTDERKDVARSTEAASKYIVDLYDRFESWPLTLAAYNGGRTRVSRAIKRSGSRDFFYLAENGYLPKETARYVPKVLAIAHILRSGGLTCE